MARRTLQAAVRLGGLLLACGCLLLPGHAALAQMGMPQLGSVNGMTGSPVHGPQQQSTPVERPPPVGLPGASPKAAPAPATQPAASMNPTDALFDAINRGDLGAAQDALSRGADLNGTNVLGMTPLQLSIDLEHNDITFLLLSAGGEGSAQAPQTAGRGKPPTKVVRSATLTRNTERQRTKPMHTAMVAPAPMQTPRLFTGDGGSPIPSAGFLGFGSGR
jgi:hypothetical protein